MEVLSVTFVHLENIVKSKEQLIRRHAWIAPLDTTRILRAREIAPVVVRATIKTAKVPKNANRVLMNMARR